MYLDVIRFRRQVVHELPLSAEGYTAVNVSLFHLVEQRIVLTLFDQDVDEDVATLGMTGPISARGQLPSGLECFVGFCMIYYSFYVFLLQ